MVKHYPVILVFTLLLTLSISVFTNSMFVSNDSDSRKKKIQVGLVGDTSESYLGMGITAIQSFDSSQYYVEFLELDEKTAKEMLEDGELYGYILIPEKFVWSIVTGENKHLTYVAANSPATLGPMIMEEVTKVVSDFVIYSQYGIYAMSDLASRYGVSDEMYDEALVELNLKYINTILEREGVYNIEVLGVSDGLAFKDYYICAFLLVLLLLWGMSCSGFLIKKDMSLPRVLKSTGCSTLSQVLGDYIPFFIIMFFNTGLLTGGCVWLVNAYDVELGYLSDFVTWQDGLLLSLSLLPAVALITVMQFFLYELSGNMISGVLLQLLATVGLSYVSGFFFPLYSMPSAIQRFAKILPTRVAFENVADVMKGDMNTSTLGIAFLYFIIFILLSCMVREHKMRSNRYD